MIRLHSIQRSFAVATLIVSAGSILGCSVGVEAQATEDREAVTGSITAKREIEIEAGKYVSHGQILMIYGRCSSQNFLGAARGDLGLDGRTLSVEEGNVCGSYRLTPIAAGVIEVSWNKPADAHLGVEVEDNCRSVEGSFAMTQSSAYQDIAPGEYKRGGRTTLSVPVGCGGATLAFGSATTAGEIVPRPVAGRLKPFFQVEEGNVCGGYVIDAVSSRSVKVTWEKPADSHLGEAVETSCREVEGTYTR